MLEEVKRIEENRKHEKHWHRWGPYLSSRQWGTVREDYSSDENPWNSFPFDMAKSRAYRWGEDGIGGLSDNHQRLCFAPAFWNGQDPFLKERLFGLSNPEGNHGEDVKEYYFFIDNTPTHSYMKYLYKYPQKAFPYDDLRKINRERSQNEREYELLDTGIFKDNNYFDIFLEYAKINAEDLAIQVRICNRSKEEKDLHFIPMIWARNTWSWGAKDQSRPQFKMASENGKQIIFEIQEKELGERFFYAPPGGEVLATENETNYQGLWGQPNSGPYVKDAFDRYIVRGEKEAVNPQKEGSKLGIHYLLKIPGGGEKILLFRLSDSRIPHPFDQAENALKKRKEEADAFYASFIPKSLSETHRMVERQALAGMLWNKQFYYYVVERWLAGDNKGNLQKRRVRNKDWPHVYADDVIPTPDNWEYPALFSWDIAFHAIPLAMVDPEYVKKVLDHLTREWYMHPNGQVPAYEWGFSDVNPPVHAWAAWRVYKIEKKITGRVDRLFLESVFQKLLMNFTWWVNRKDAAGKNIFQGGFLGLDNISVFNRSDHLPAGAELYQSDATSWMGLFCLNMLAIALELARSNPTYQDIASKFYEHFLFIADAINFTENETMPLWNEEDGFYYDVITHPDGRCQHLKVRSMVGIIPLFAVSVLEPGDLEMFKGFKKRMDWFISNRKDLCGKVACMETHGIKDRRLLALVHKEKLVRILKYLLDEQEFLSPYGIRSLSKFHEKHPFSLQLDHREYRVDYEPGESTSRLFGGNSNWRGPIWFPLNVLIIESLQKYHYYYGDELKIECPTGSGRFLTLWEVAKDIEKRLASIFCKDERGNLPCFGKREIFTQDPYWKDLYLFNEYFHGDTGEGLGASHQTGWTGLIAKLIQQLGEYMEKKPLKK